MSDAAGARVTRLLVIGAGPGGESAAKRAAARGARVTLVEKDDLGGLCLNRGCIPSKTLLEAGRLLHRARNSASLRGREGLSIDWPALRARQDAVVAGLRAALEQNLRRLNVRVVKGEAVLTGPHEARVGEETIPFDAAVLAAGSAPFAPPPFDALAGQYLDSDRALALPAVPERLLVVGGGAIGCEFACLFHELGARVALVEKTAELLPGEDPAVARGLRTSFEKRGIRVFTSATVTEAARIDGKWRAALSSGTAEEVDHILVCVGRRPAAAGLRPEAAGVRAEGGRVPVNEFLQTNQSHIYAVGDVNGLSLLAHAAAAQAEAAVDHLFGAPRAYDNALVPRCLYTWPEVASVGEWAHSARERGMEVKTQRSFFQASPKALALEEPEGFIQAVSDKSTGRLLGAQIIGPHATDLIHTFAAALAAKMTTENLKGVTFAHPTLSEGIREALSR